MSDKLRSSQLGSSVLPDKPKNPQLRPSNTAADSNGTTGSAFVSLSNTRRPSRDSTPLSQHSYSGPNGYPQTFMSPYSGDPYQMTHSMPHQYPQYYHHQTLPMSSPYWYPSPQTNPQYANPIQHAYPYPPNVYNTVPPGGYRQHVSPRQPPEETSHFVQPSPRQPTAAQSHSVPQSPRQPPISSIPLAHSSPGQPPLDLYHQGPSYQHHLPGSLYQHRSSVARGDQTQTWHSQDQNAKQGKSSNQVFDESTTVQDKNNHNSSKSCSASSRGQSPASLNDPSFAAPLFSTPHVGYSYAPYVQHPQPVYPMAPTGYDHSAMQMYNQWHKMYSDYMQNLYYPLVRKSKRRSNVDHFSVGKVSANQNSLYSPVDSSVNGGLDEDAQSRITASDEKSSPTSVVLSPTNTAVTAANNRSTPFRYSNVHSVAKFSSNGSLLFTDAINGASSHVYIYSSVNNRLVPQKKKVFPDFFHSFPGPLYGWNWRCQKCEVKRFMVATIKDYEKMSTTMSFDRSEFEDVNDVNDFILLLKYLLLLINNDGPVDEIDICQLLSKQYEDDVSEHSNSGLGSPNSVSLSDLNETGLTSPTDKKDVVLAKLTKLLLRGELKQFIDLALKERYYGIALRFSQLMSPAVFQHVCEHFDNSSIGTNEVLRTFVNVKTDKPLSLICDVAIVDWKQHLAVIMSNVKDFSLMSQYCVALGDILSSAKRVYAAQFCYLVAQCTFSWPSTQNGAGKLVLFGLPSAKSFNSHFVRENLLSIVLTVVFEYCIKAYSPQFFIPFLQFCKLRLARECFDGGLHELAFKYCESIFVNVVLHDNVFNCAFVLQLLDLTNVLAFRLNKADESWVKKMRGLHSSWSGLSLSDSLSSSKFVSATALENSQNSKSFKYDASMQQSEVPVSTFGAIPKVAYSTRESFSLDRASDDEQKRNQNMTSSGTTKYATSLHYTESTNTLQPQSTIFSQVPPIDLSHLQTDDEFLIMTSGTANMELNNPVPQNEPEPPSEVRPRYPGPILPEDDVNASEIAPPLFMKPPSTAALPTPFQPLLFNNVNPPQERTEMPTEENYETHIPNNENNVHRSNTDFSTDGSARNVRHSVEEQLNIPGTVSEESYKYNNEYSNQRQTYKNDNYPIYDDVNYYSSQSVNVHRHSIDSTPATGDPSNYTGADDGTLPSSPHAEDSDDHSDEDESADGSNETSEDENGEEEGTTTTTHDSSAVSSLERSGTIASSRQSSRSAANANATLVNNNNNYYKSSRSSSIPNENSSTMQTNNIPQVSRAPTTQPLPPHTQSYQQNTNASYPPNNSNNSVAPNPFSRSGTGAKLNQYQQYPNSFKVSQPAKFLPPPALPTPQHMYEPTEMNPLSSGEVHPAPELNPNHHMQQSASSMPGGGPPGQQSQRVGSDQSIFNVAKATGNNVQHTSPAFQTPNTVPSYSSTASNSNFAPMQNQNKFTIASDQNVASYTNSGDVLSNQEVAPLANVKHAPQNEQFAPSIPTFFNPSKFTKSAPFGPPMMPPLVRAPNEGKS